MAETVLDNAPPAVLFRLSYRTQDHYRSGHRDSDSREQVVESMRGWWEIDPRDLDSLEIKHAVAFHAGVTLAVVRIGGWKWHVTKNDEHHTLPVDDLGQPMSEFDWANPPAGVRWAFDVADDPMGDIAHEAWIGESDKLVPARLRDTIKSYWPDSPDDSARDLLGKALELLGRSLYVLGDPRFRTAWGANWHDELRRRHGILEGFRFTVPRDDPYIHLKILQRERNVASALLGRDADKTLHDSVQARNRWAHFADISATEARDAVDEIIDLVARGRIGAKSEGLSVENERIDQHLARLKNIRRALDFQTGTH